MATTMSKKTSVVHGVPVFSGKKKTVSAVDDVVMEHREAFEMTRPLQNI
jgi:uncharacterized protein YrrD